MSRASAGRSTPSAKTKRMPEVARRNAVSPGGPDGAGFGRNWIIAAAAIAPPSSRRSRP